MAKTHKDRKDLYLGGFDPQEFVDDALEGKEQEDEDKQEVEGIDFEWGEKFDFETGQWDFVKVPIKETKETKKAKKESGKVKTYTSQGATTGNWGGYTGGTGYHYKNCHHFADKMIFEHEGVRIHVGGRDTDSTGAKLIIDCAQVFTSSKRFIKGSYNMSQAMHDKFVALNKHLTMPPVLSLDWPDRSSPNSVPLKFWQDLWKMLPKGKVILCCFGGHGRSGTACAALLIANGMEPRDAIRYVRDIHCREAIETTGQENYLLSLAPSKKKKAKKEAKETKKEAKETKKEAEKEKQGVTVKKVEKPSTDKKEDVQAKKAAGSASQICSEVEPSGRYTKKELETFESLQCLTATIEDLEYDLASFRAGMEGATDEEWRGLYARKLKQTEDDLDEKRKQHVKLLAEAQAIAAGKEGEASTSSAK